MSNSKTGHALYSMWLSLYNEEFGHSYKGSRYRDASMMQRISEDVGYDEFVSTMEEFVDAYSEPKIERLVFDYHELRDELDRKARARRDIERIRAKTRQRMEELG